MDAYDPLTAPDPHAWEALDEQEALDLVVAYHRAAGVTLPNPQAHAVIHAVVENQLAEADIPVHTTLDRLMREGLDRHEAVHAIGTVLAGFLHALMTAPHDPPPDASDRYFEQLENLTAAKWRKGEV